MRRTGRWQLQSRQPQRLGLARVLVALCAVVQCQCQIRAALTQACKVVDLSGTNRAIQTAFSLAAGVHIPQAQPACQQPLTAARLVITRRLCTLRPQGLEKRPELVLRMGVILLLLQRFQPGEAAQHQRTRARIGHRSQPLPARASLACRRILSHALLSPSRHQRALRTAIQKMSN